MHYGFVMLTPREKALHCFVLFLNVFKLSRSWNNALCDLSAVCRFLKSPKDYVDISRKSTKNRMTEGMGSGKKWTEFLRSLPFSVEWYPKNGISAPINSTVFRRYLKEYALNFQLWKGSNPMLGQSVTIYQLLENPTAKSTSYFQIFKKVGVKLYHIYLWIE